MKDIQRTIDRYLAGETTPQEENRLALELNMCHDLPQEWQMVREMLGDLAAGEAEYDAILAEKEARNPRKSRKSRKNQNPRLIRFAWAAAACVAAVAIGLWMMRTAPETEPQVTQITARVEPKLEQIEPKQPQKVESIAPVEPRPRKAKAIVRTQPVDVEPDATLVPQQPANEESPEPEIIATDENLAQFMQLTQSIQQRGERLMEMAAMMTAERSEMND